MNELIRLLSIEAGKYVNTLMIDYLDLSDELYAIKWNQEYNKKFAELIVKECAELANEETSLPYDSYSEKIKQHFGVEE